MYQVGLAYEHKSWSIYVSNKTWALRSKWLKILLYPDHFLDQKIPVIEDEEPPKTKAWLYILNSIGYNCFVLLF